MKIDNEWPFIENGWLIAGEKVLYGNSPILRVSSISFINYFEDTSKAPSQLQENGTDNEWYITFGEGQNWRYKDKADAYEDYEKIISMVVGFSKNENKEYI